MRVLLIVYDNSSYMSYFPLGLAYIAAVLEHNGHECDIWDESIYHYSQDQLKSKIESSNYDYIGLSMCGGYYQYRKLLELSSIIARCSNRQSFQYLIGGHMSAADPDYFLKKTLADICVIGEGEQTIIRIVDKKPLNQIPGIAYRINDNVFKTPTIDLIKDIDTIPFPAHEKFNMDVYRLIRMPNAGPLDYCFPILSARGCVGLCNFCYRLDKGIRTRSPENILQEMLILNKKWKINYFTFGDELFTSNSKKVRELCNMMISSGIPGLKWDCNARVDTVNDEILGLMKKAGCTFINYGIESVDDTVLKNMNKRTTHAQQVKAVEATIAAGISPGLNIIWGNIGDSIESLQKGVDFLIKYDDQAQLRSIRPVTPYPGSPLFDWCIEKGLIKDVEDFYENKHKNSDLFTCDIMQIGIEKATDALFYANKQLLINYHRKKLAATIHAASGVYFLGQSFRGFR